MSFSRGDQGILWVLWLFWNFVLLLLEGFFSVFKIIFYWKFLTWWHFCYIQVLERGNLFLMTWSLQVLGWKPLFSLPHGSVMWRAWVQGRLPLLTDLLSLLSRKWGTIWRVSLGGRTCTAWLTLSLRFPTDLQRQCIWTTAAQEVCICLALATRHMDKPVKFKGEIWTHSFITSKPQLLIYFCFFLLLLLLFLCKQQSCFDLPVSDYCLSFPHCSPPPFFWTLERSIDCLTPW